MGGGRRADQDGVNIRTLDDLVEGRDLGAGGRGEFLRCGRVRVGDRDEARIRMAGGVAAVNAADAASAQNGDPDHVFPDIFRRLTGKFRIDVPARDANRINILQHQAPR